MVCSVAGSAVPYRRSPRRAARVRKAGRYNSTWRRDLLARLLVSRTGRIRPPRIGREGVGIPAPGGARVPGAGAHRDHIRRTGFARLFQGKEKRTRRHCRAGRAYSTSKQTREWALVFPLDPPHLLSPDGRLRAADRSGGRCRCIASVRRSVISRACTSCSSEHVPFPARLGWCGAGLPNTKGDVHGRIALHKTALLEHFLNPRGRRRCGHASGRPGRQGSRRPSLVAYRSACCGGCGRA
jgi:hypothetical protein